VEVSKEKFQEILEEQPSILDIGTNGESKEDLHWGILKEMSMMISMRLSQEIMHKVYRNQEIFSNTPLEILDKILKDVEIKMSDELLKKTMEIPGTYSKMVEIQKHQCDVRLGRSGIIFRHCIRADILEGTVSPEEKEFAYEAQKVTIKFVEEKDRDLESAVKGYHKYFTECFEKCKDKNSDSIK
jgi:hypothetical protein